MKTLDARFLAVVFIAFLVAELPSTARADFGDDAGVWIVSAATSAGLTIQTGTPQTTVYDVSVGIGHSLGSSLELLVLGTYASVSNPGLPQNSQGEVDGQLNLVLGGGHSDAFYVGARAGTQFFDQYGASSSDLVFGGAIGKRFPLASIVSYEPEATVMFTDSSGTISSPRIGFVPLQFTLVF